MKASWQTRLEDDIARLGAMTPDQIAASLKASHIRGAKSDPCDCILARRWRWLTGQHMRIGPVYVGHNGAPSNWRVEINGEGRIALPSSLALFADRYDRGDFPELFEKESAASLMCAAETGDLEE